MSDGNGGEALVHHGMLPGSGQRDDYQRRGGGDGGETKGEQVDFAEDLNVDLGKEGGRGRYVDITVEMKTAGLEDLARHFFPRRRAWCQYRRTRVTRRQGRVVRSRMDYIMGSDRRIFQNVAVRDRMDNSDHFMVVGNLRGASLR